MPQGCNRLQRTFSSSSSSKPPAYPQALKRYSEYLTPFEQSEVLQYQQVWFLGKADVQKIRGNPHLAKTNHGYDDERGDYVVTMHDHIGYRYEVLGVLGKGSFGQVLKVLDYKTGAYRALKIIRNKKRFHHQAQARVCEGQRRPCLAAALQCFGRNTPSSDRARTSTHTRPPRTASNTG